MDEKAFEDAAAAMLSRIDSALEDCGLDLDVTQMPGGVLQVEFADGSQIIINRHSAAREIWVAARAGGFHFRPEKGGWVDTRSGEKLQDTLAKLISQQSGEPCRLPMGD